MERSEAGVVIVGITGPGRETAALTYAAEQARLVGAGVLLVHVVRLSVPPPPGSILMESEQWDDVAETIVRQVHEEFEDLTEGAVACRRLVRRGSPARELAELSRDASMVVLQHRHSGLLGRIFVGSTLNGAAAHAHCPVVSVPESWTPDSGRGEVVVGMHEDGGPHEVVAAGFAQAAGTRSSVRLVNAWRLDHAYDDLVTDRVAEDWRTQQDQRISQAVESLRRAHPDVPFEVDVRRQWPADALLDLSKSAALVVVGRHGSRTWLPGQLGSVPRAVLREASCPVMVVPVGEHRPDPDVEEVTPDEVSPQA